MTPKTLTYYDWFEEVQPKLCELMGIEEKYFRDYHKLVGGEYKDFWHVYLDLFNIPGNDCFYRQFWDQGNAEDISTLEEYSGDNEWKMLLVNALEQLHKELESDCICVWISW